MKKLLVLLALLLPLSACASARAQVQPEDNPALDVPPVPPRQVEPLPVEPPPIELVADLPPTPAAPRPRPPSAREPNHKPATDPKAESKPETQDPSTPAAQVVPPLRPQGTGDGPELQRQIRDVIDRANKILNNVDYQSLNDERRANYDYAKSYIKQAEEAIKANNLTSAKSLAERAETIAKLLAGG